MIDLCVVNFNAADKLERFIETLHSDAQAYARPWKLYIADNGSTDHSAKVLESYCVDSPIWNGKTMYDTVAFQNENIGYAAACNQLAAEGHSPIIGLLNSDVWMTTGDVLKIEQSFARNPEIAILGPKQRDENGYVTHAGIFGSMTKPTMRAWKYHDPEDTAFRDLEECVTISGSAYFIRREVWDVLSTCAIYKAMYPDIDGAFLPTPHYYEETWCSYHALSHGFRIFYDGTVSIGHSWHSSAPHGGGRDGYWQVSQSMFRMACDNHGIEHD